MKALGVDTEDDIYLLSNYFLKGPSEGGQAEEGSEKGAKDEDTMDEKEGREEPSGGVDEGDKRDDEGSVVFSVDEQASDSSSVKAHLSGNKAVVLFPVYTWPQYRLLNVQQISAACGNSYIKRTGVLVGNFERTPERYQDPVLWVWLVPLRGTSSKATHYLPSDLFRLNTLKHAAKARTVDLLRLNILRATKTAF